MIHGSPNTGMLAGKLGVPENQIHIINPVDEFEVQRNNRIYGYQKNRNPYIDRPEFFESVYYYLLDIAGSIRSNSYKETIEIYQTIQVLYVPEYQRIEL